VKFILRDFEAKGVGGEGQIFAGPLPRVTSYRAARIRCKIRKRYRNMSYWLRRTCAG
jgi:hypothetical protein